MESIFNFNKRQPWMAKHILFMYFEQFEFLLVLMVVFTGKL